MKPRILFVDDEPKILAALQRMLCDREDEWDMSFVVEAGDALERARAGDLDVIVTDIYMPYMDGFELLEALRSDERTRHIPVIVLTGSHDHLARQRALDLDAVDLLNKPADPRDVIARVRNAVRLKHYRDQLMEQNDILEKKVAERTRELEVSRLDIIWRLANAGEHHDEMTGNHVVRVGCYCRELGRALDLDDVFIERLFLAGPLHDIGKIGIPDHILLKPGDLDEHEWDVMKQHCVIGAEILREHPRFMRAYLARYGLDDPPPENNGGNPVLQMASSIALAHHERWDGTGYPGGLAHEQIPLEARIVAVADVFDALCSERPYKPSMNENDAWHIMREQRGRHFDPRLCDVMEDCTEQFIAIRQEFPDEPVECATIRSML